MSADRAYPSDVFDRLSRNYDELVEHRDDFPFVGYRNVLLGIIEAAAPVAGMRVLELGVGTGNLALLFEEVGREIWAVDYSRRMIEQASRKLRRTHLIEADLLEDWWGEVPAPFDRIVASYALHHFDLPTKCRLLRRMADELLTEAGWMVLGDVSFPTRSALQAVRDELGDDWEDEDYWVAEEAVEALAGDGLSVEYRQVSSCGGIYTVRC